LPDIDDHGPVPLPTSPHRLVKITFEARGRGRPEIEHEREVAIYDIIESNYFAPCDADGTPRGDGPYILTVGLVEDRLVMRIATQAKPEDAHALMLSLSPLRKIMKDYFMVCDTYYQAIRTQPPSKIQAIDMGRRGLHNEGSRVLSERLAGKVIVDHDTARRLFTLVCALHWKG
jgi:uncharacterized protein (UPF0262 family)